MNAFLNDMLQGLGFIVRQPGGWPLAIFAAFAVLLFLYFGVVAPLLETLQGGYERWRARKLYADHAEELRAEAQADRQRRGLDAVIGVGNVRRLL